LAIPFDSLRYSFLRQTFSTIRRFAASRAVADRSFDL
jgi:hypothetical protein